MRTKKKELKLKRLIGALRMWFTVANIKHLVLLLPNHWRIKKVLNGLVKETDEYKSTYVAVKIKSYSIRTVAKCVSEYLAHESNQQ